MLLPLKQSLIFEKNNCKRYLIKVFGAKYSKIVLVLLNKVIAIYVRLIFVYVGGLSLERLILTNIIFINKKKVRFFSKKQFIF